MKRRSLGHSLADALRNGTACVTSNLEPTALSEKRIHRTRVEIYPTKVLATFPLKHGEQILDLTFRTQLPNLVDPLAEGFRTWGSANSAGSRYEAARSLERGIVKFLSADYAGITLAEIDTTVLTAFLKWLDRGKTSLKSKATNPNYRRSTAGTFRVVLMALIGHPSWKGCRKRASYLSATHTPERKYKDCTQKQINSRAPRSDRCGGATRGN